MRSRVAVFAVLFSLSVPTVGHSAACQTLEATYANSKNFNRIVYDDGVPNQQRWVYIENFGPGAIAIQKAFNDTTGAMTMPGGHVTSLPKSTFQWTIIPTDMPARTRITICVDDPPRP